TIEKVAATWPKATDEAPVKPAPVIVTEVPTGPRVGENPEIVGPAANAGTADPTKDPAATARTASAVACLPQRKRINLVSSTGVPDSTLLGRFCTGTKEFRS